MCSFQLILNWMLFNTINYIKMDIVTIFLYNCKCLGWFGQVYPLGLAIYFNIYPLGLAIFF